MADVCGEENLKPEDAVVGGDLHHAIIPVDGLLDGDQTESVILAVFLVRQYPSTLDVEFSFVGIVFRDIDASMGFEDLQSDDTLLLILDLQHGLDGIVDDVSKQGGDFILGKEINLLPVDDAIQDDVVLMAEEGLLA